MAKDAELDEGLVAGLKAAKSKRAYFALILKGGADGALIVSKTKVSPAEIAAGKKRSGGSALIQGFCNYDDGTYVFETAKTVANTAAQAVKSIVKRDAGTTVKAEFRVSTDPELLTGDGESAPIQAGTEAKKEFSSSELAKSRVSWAAAKKKIHGDMEKLGAAIRGEIPDEATLGVELVAYVNDMLTILDKDFETALDAVTRAGTAPDRQAARTAALGVLDRYQKTVAINPGVKQIEKNPFLPLSILTPLNATLDVIMRYLIG